MAIVQFFANDEIASVVEFTDCLRHGEMIIFEFNLVSVSHHIFEKSLSAPAWTALPFTTFTA